MKKFVICSLMVSFAFTTAKGQVTPPIWWYGISGAANFNFYTGTTQRLNNSLIVPTPFHKGTGLRPYASVLVEYRPGPVWGGMLNVGYDGLGAKFDGVEAPCNCPANLKSELSYVSIEPSLRLGFTTSSLYFFAGPSLAINVNKGFAYTQLKQPNTNADFSSVNSTMFSGQVGAGFDIPLSAASSESKVSLSPFISYHPYFGQDPRSIESLSITTVRVGLALKFGKGHNVVPPPVQPPVQTAMPPHDFIFTVRGPKPLLELQVSETLPLLSVVFFDEGSTEVPNRYVMLTRDQASGFKEESLQQEQSKNRAGRSAGQLNVYHNVLNILGDRMRANPGATITLDGASAKGPEEGRELAGSVKLYLVTVFGIDASRIAVKGSYWPTPPSEHPGGTKELVLLRAEDRRVDIRSASPELLIEVGGRMMKPVQFTSYVDPLDSHVVFNVDSAKELLKSWTIDITDEKGTVQHYGPFTNNQESVPGSTILGNSLSGDYQIVMLGETNNGLSVKKESSIHLVHQDETIKKGLRYSIVFNFDKSTTIASYDKFLRTIVSPLITDGATVNIHGHTDIIGGQEYNQKLSDKRAQQTHKILARAIANSGRDNVKFETVGFGEDPAHSPFENTSPEERFYNRTVIIDIVPVK